jgi:hypothetical protein
MFAELLVVVTHSPMATGDDPGTEAGWSGGLEATRQAYMLGTVTVSFSAPPFYFEFVKIFSLDYCNTFIYI